MDTKKVIKQFLKQKKRELWEFVKGMGLFATLLVSFIFVIGFFSYFFGYIAYFTANIYLEEKLWIYPFWYDFLYSHEQWFKEATNGRSLAIIGLMTMLASWLVGLIFHGIFQFFKWIGDNWERAKLYVERQEQKEKQ